MKRLALLALGLGLAFAGPLEDYVNKPDSNYAWRDTGYIVNGTGWTGYILNMTSQAWLTPADWRHENGAGNLWWHFMLMIVPDTVLHPDVGMVWITGGNNNGRLPSGDDTDAFVTSALAVNTGTIGMALFQVPNQPIYFNEEKPTPQRRSEDGIIAWTWKHFIENTKDAEWIARLPMTKAVVRAMDTMSAWVKQKFYYNMQKFIVAGASKRGWTTWTTAAVDKRVIAAIPVVMDELNFVENIHHHFRSYGGWSFALSDYYKVNITIHLDSPEVAKLMEIEDPISYKSKLTMPKLVVSAAGDEFFLPTDTRYWWDDMTDEKHLMLVENAEHAMITGLHKVIPAVQAFAWGVLTNTPRPSFKWVHDDDNGVITVYNNPGSPRPLNVTMFYAFSAPNTGRRDWRLVAGWPNPTLQLVLWKGVELKEQPEGNKWIAVAPKPPAGQWTGFFVDMRYAAPPSPQYPLHYRHTTSVGVTPNTFPFPRCQGQGCYGHLL